MREIIFRAKRLYDGEWIEGNLFIPDLPDTPTQICMGTNVVRISYDVDPETIGQFTGIYDKNGKKIFEGDVVRSVSRQNEVVGVMVFHDGGFELDQISFNEFSMEQGFSMSDLELGQVIIGNIYDLNVKSEDQNGTS